MRKAISVIVIAAAAKTAFAADYATCLLDKLPGVKNAPAHAAALNLCAQQHPDKFFEVRRGSGRGILGPKSPEQCTLDKARDTAWQPAAGMIMRACGCLYTPSAGPTDMCERYPLSAEIRAQHPLVKTDADLLKLETHYRKIYAAHPDADALFARKDFWAWVTQDKAREQALTKGSTADVVRVLGDFKSSGRADTTWLDRSSTVVAPESEIERFLRDAPPQRPAP